MGLAEDIIKFLKSDGHHINQTVRDAAVELAETVDEQDAAYEEELDKEDADEDLDDDDQ